MVNVLKKALPDYSSENLSCPAATAICYVPCVHQNIAVCQEVNKKEALHV